MYLHLQAVKLSYLSIKQSTKLVIRTKYSWKCMVQVVTVIALKLDGPFHRLLCFQTKQAFESYANSSRCQVIANINH